MRPLAEPLIKRGQHFPKDENARQIRGGLGLLKDPAVDRSSLEPGVGLAGLYEGVRGALWQGAL